MILDRINGPKDLKTLSASERKELAQEIRQAMLKRASIHGGHFGPDFGIVEATIALHTVFDSPEDKIVWDVSHQVYPHKILTGRKQAYLEEEHYDDVSGYSNPAESEHDFFEVGHTSTSISLASGLAMARDLRGGHENIIAVIGDGSMSGGEALEGLDTVGEMGTNMIIVLNDNQMSIAEVHGGMYKGFDELRRTGGKSEHNLFRAMGLDYRFVADGNDSEALIKVFREVKDIDHPVVVHIVTQKGKGYKFAEEDKESWHWHMPFDIETGEVKHPYVDEAAELTATYLLDRMKTDKKLAVLTAATPSSFGFTSERRKQAGKQFIDVGIAEEQAVAMASGLAKGGARPVFGDYATFFQRTYDQISQDVCINNNPAVFLVFGASMYSMNDVTHLCIFDIPMMANIPNLVYLAPVSFAEYKAMLAWALDQTEHPVAIRVPVLPVSSEGRAIRTDYSQLNTYEVTRRGEEVAILGLGNFYGLAEQTAAELEKKGIHATIINPTYITGLDTDLLESLKKDHRLVVTMEDGVLDGGFGEKIARFYGNSDMKTCAFGLEKKFYDRYDYEKLAEEYNLKPELAAKKILDLIK
ncbi:MAG: 1-deoxy-D-xylulose-5-phosphate synthase [Allisonella histaminiformans]|uniref:1-deoxy-D-xylulose-5-phosphate synthase n=1 Tax=Allisonella histaminiformans TaxID=209880 RepID=UPI002A826E7B|nr:1-deoxy-D-xylulose-5-phosphate synthase [Allisonella histaminiformans]MDY3956847.1 1-deoxy-D-xylulose-5-phosphate synthase [Allisonella histaminiformans]